MMDDIRQTVHRSPPLGIVAIVFVALFAASIVANIIITGGAPYPTPYRPIAELQQYYERFPHALKLTAFLQLGAMVPLVVYAAAAASRLAFHGIDAAGVNIALVAGSAAGIFLGMSAACTWALSQPGVATDAGAMRSMQLIAFATGGFAHTLALGLLVAGLGVPALVFGLLPRWIGASGIIVSGACISGIFALLRPEAFMLLPLGRFSAYLWLIAAGFALPRARPVSLRASAA